MPRADDGALVVSWVVKLAVTLAILGVVAIDGVSLLVGRLQAEDDAQSAATAAAQSFQSSHDIRAAYAAAQGALGSSRERVLTRGFSISSTGTADVIVTRQVSTLLLGDIGPLRHYTVQTVTASETPPSL